MRWLLKSCLFALMLGVAAAQQSTNNSPDVTNGVASSTIEEIKAKAETGDAQAQFQLGTCYFFGQGVATNYNETVEWIRKSADQGFALAEYALGFMYTKGDLGLLPKDEPEAVKWYRKAAEQGLADAQYNLGVCYAHGTGVAKDEDEASKWFLESAEQGQVDAQTQLGLIKLIFKQEYADADKWLQKAAEKDDAEAEHMLGLMRLYGWGMEKDYVEAAKWIQRSAEHGSTEAQINIGVMYHRGQGVEKDYTEAYAWWNLAARNSTEAASKRTILEKQMTPEQVAEAQKRTKELRVQVQAHLQNEQSQADPFSIAQVRKSAPTASGSGFFITDDGYLISNYHVVKDATKVHLVTSAGTVDAKVVQVDAANDLALLKADGRFTPLPILPSRSAHLGGTVATIGFPDPTLQGFSPKLAKGEIASLSGASDDPRYFQISVPVQPGNSGGALVDDRGNVIGIVSAKLDASVALAASGALPENVNYAVKSSLLLSFLESVPAVSAKLKQPNTVDEKFEDVVKSAQDAAVLVLVY